MANRKRTNSRGFTLLEVIGVLVILGVISVYVGNQIAPDQYNVAGEAANLQTAIRYAQSLGFTQAYLPDGVDTVVWGINLSGTSYQLFRNGASQNDINLPGQNSNSYTLPSGINITGGTVYFDFRGIPCSSTGAPVNGDTNFTISDGTDSSQFTLLANTGFIQ